MLARTRPILLTSLAHDVAGDPTRRACVAAVLTKPTRQSRLYDTLVEVGGLGNLTPHHEAPPDVIDRPRTPSAGRIPLAEDSPVTRLVALGMLEALGYGADVAQNGIGAATALAEREYAAVLMDCQMHNPGCCTRSMNAPLEHGRSFPRPQVW